MPDSSIHVIELNEGQDFLHYRQGSGGTVEIFDIAVNSERGVGRGRQLINLLFDEVRQNTHLVFAITRESNQIARQFYAALGFYKLGELHRFYQEESAIMYGRKP